MILHLRIVIAISLLYDFAIGAGFFFFASNIAIFFKSPSPSPPIIANLLGLFALTAAFCYILPFINPSRWKNLLWLLGPFLKGTGAIVFIADHFFRGSPSSYLIFAFADGFLALWTAVILLAWKDKP